MVRKQSTGGCLCDNSKPSFLPRLTGVHFRGELQHVGHVGEQKLKCQSIRTRKIAGVRCKTNYMTDPVFDQVSFRLSDVAHRNMNQKCI